MKQAIDGMLKAFRLEDKISQVKLIDSWEKIMGPSVAKRTTGLRIVGRKLFVNLDSASLRQELFREREKILGLLHEAAGANLLDDIVFQ
jgi:hypothetical protein